MSGANELTLWCGPWLAIRPSRSAKISGAATALASVPSTMAMALPVNAARSGSIWRQQYANVALVDAFGKRVRSPMENSWWSVEWIEQRAHRWCAVRAQPEGNAGREAPRPARAFNPFGVDWPASVASRAEVGPGHADPPSEHREGGQQVHD